MLKEEKLSILQGKNVTRHLVLESSSEENSQFISAISNKEKPMDKVFIYSQMDPSIKVLFRTARPMINKDSINLLSLFIAEDSKTIYSTEGALNKAKIISLRVYISKEPDIMEYCSGNNKAQIFHTKANLTNKMSSMKKER